MSILKMWMVLPHKQHKYLFNPQESVHLKSKVYLYFVRAIRVSHVLRKILLERPLDSQVKLFLKKYILRGLNVKIL